jgi:alpha-glucosidase
MCSTLLPTGIELRLDYIKDLGVGAVWLSPIYKSPMKDFGYDIQDFRDIDPVFGTMDDFHSLSKAMKERGKPGTVRDLGTMVKDSPH